MSIAIEINPDEDYGTVNEEEAAMFLNNVRKTEQVVRAAQKERGAKNGELVVRAVMEHFWVKEGNRNVASNTPAKPESRTGKKGTSYNAGLPLQVTIEEFAQYIPDLCEKRKDGQPGWHIKWTLSFFDNARKFLINPVDESPSAAAVAAWHVHTIPQDDVQAYGLKEAALQHGLTEEGLANDLLSTRIRQCIGRDGVLAKELWTNVARGESVRFKAPDYTPKDNLLRAQLPSGAYAVQPSSQLIFNHVVPTIYVTFDDAAAAAVKQEDTNGVPTLPSTTTTAVAAAVVKKKEANLGMIFSYECKGSVLLRENKEASDLCASERMHLTRNKDIHQLVPIHVVRASVTEVIPKTVYFFVPPRYITRWTPEHPVGHGISLFRNTLQPNDLKSTPNAQGGEVYYSFVTDLAVFQWHDKPNIKERYVVNGRVRRGDENIWRSWGITNGDAYAAIMMANQEIPFHLTLNFWKKATMERPANDPKEMNRNKGTENICGYYDFIIDNVVPDYLRYFRARGIRLSRAFVEQEFSDWGSISKKTKATMLTLQPYAKLHTRDNPLHSLQGLSSAVVSLGNGQPPPADMPNDWPKLTDQEGYYHACKGDITHMLAPNGRYQFYVLTSRSVSEEERSTIMGEEADQWLTEQIERAAKSHSTFYYWIFAVDTQAKIAKQQDKTKVVVTVPTPEIKNNVATKRERQDETEQQQDGDDVKKHVRIDYEEEEEEKEIYE